MFPIVLAERHYGVENPLTIEIDDCEFVCKTTLRAKAQGSTLRQGASTIFVKEEIMKDSAIGGYFASMVRELRCRNSSSDIVELLDTFCRVLNSADLIRRFIVEHPEAKDAARAFEYFKLARLLNEWKISLFERLKRVQGRKVKISSREVGPLVEAVKKELSQGFGKTQQMPPALDTCSRLMQGSSRVLGPNWRSHRRPFYRMPLDCSSRSGLTVCIESELAWWVRG